MDLLKLIKDLLNLEADTDLILQGICPECEEPMPDDDNDTESDLCFLCPKCREQHTK